MNSESLRFALEIAGTIIMLLVSASSWMFWRERDRRDREVDQKIDALAKKHDDDVREAQRSKEAAQGRETELRERIFKLETSDAVAERDRQHERESVRQMREMIEGRFDRQDADLSDIAERVGRKVSRSEMAAARPIPRQEPDSEPPPRQPRPPRQSTGRFGGE